MVSNERRSFRDRKRSCVVAFGSEFIVSGISSFLGGALFALASE